MLLKDCWNNVLSLFGSRTRNFWSKKDAYLNKKRKFVHKDCVNFEINMFLCCSHVYISFIFCILLTFIFSIIRILDYPDYLSRSQWVQIIEVWLYCYRDKEHVYCITRQKYRVCVHVAILGWESLEAHRRAMDLILFYKIQYDLVGITLPPEVCPGYA